MARPETDPLPDTRSVLRLLRTAMRVVGGDAELTIHLDGLGDPSDGTSIVDSHGRVVASLTDGDGDADDGDGAIVLAALVASYGHVLESERAVHRSLQRVRDLEEVAYRDPLTGLLNRRAWEDAVRREQARCARHPRPVAVVVIDLDHMKEVNDEQGHLAGDVLLRMTGGLLREVLRPFDVVARIGGDEFAALLVDVVDQDPDALSDRIQHDLEAEGVEASVGVAIHAGGDLLEVAFHEADRAMYRRKAASRGRGQERRHRRAWADDEV